MVFSVVTHIAKCELLFQHVDFFVFRSTRFCGKKSITLVLRLLSFSVVKLLQNDVPQYVDFLLRDMPNPSEHVHVFVSPRDVLLGSKNGGLATIPILFAQSVKKLMNLHFYH